jgi:hypothetical protein
LPKPTNSIEDFNFTTMNETNKENEVSSPEKQLNWRILILIFVIVIVLTAAITHFVDKHKRRRAWHID